MFSTWMKVRRSSVALLLGVGLLAAAGSAYGRAGGGSNYRSSSSSSSSSRSSSSSSSSSRSWSSSSSSSRSSSSYGSGSSSYSSSGSSEGGGILCGIVLLLVVLFIVFAVISSMVGESRETGALERDLEQIRRPKGRPLAELLAKLREVDPAFDTEAFKREVRASFTAVQTAWGQGDPRLSRAHLSSGVLRRFMGQLELMKREGVRNVMSDLQIHGVTLLDVQVTPWVHAIDVAIEASARDADVALTLPPDRVSSTLGLKEPTRFIEVWSYVRRPDVKSHADGGLFQQRCPSCGAPFPGGSSVECAFCNAVVNSGIHGWVLVEITQAEEHRLGKPLNLGQALRERDPNFNPVALEDRASLLFWRVVQGKALLEPALLHAACAPQLRDPLRLEIEGHVKASTRRTAHQAAVGSVELLHLWTEGELDLAAVEVRWSAREETVTVASRGITEVEPTFHADVLVLQRDVDAKSPPNRFLATDRCGHCGATVQSETAARCASCGSELGSPKTDWVIGEWMTVEAWKVRQRRIRAVEAVADVKFEGPVEPRLPPPPPAPLPGLAHVPPRVVETLAGFAFPSERKRLLQTMVALVKSDGVVSPEEAEAVLSLARAWQLPEATVQRWLSSEKAPQPQLPDPGSGAADEFMRVLVAVALLDGHLDAGEEAFLSHCEMRLGVRPVRTREIKKELS